MTFMELVGAAMMAAGALWLGRMGAAARAFEVGTADGRGAFYSIAVLLLLVVGMWLFMKGSP